jgi:hypothetical protein
LVDLDKGKRIEGIYDDGGMMAKGGMTIGSEIVGTKKMYFIYNSESGKKSKYYKSKEDAQKELNNKMALGGLFGEDRWNRGRSWTLDHKRHNKGESYEIPLKKRKRKYDNGGDIDIWGYKAELPLSNHQMKNYVIDKTGISSGTYINGKYYDTWDKIATDLGFIREENGWIKVFPSRIYTK